MIICSGSTGKVAPHKLLRGGVVFVMAPFPRTASGKLQRKKLRALLDTSLNVSVSSEEAEPETSVTPDEHKVTVGLAPVSEQDMFDALTTQSQSKQEEGPGSTNEVQSPDQPPEERHVPAHRPSIVSTTSLSTIYSESPLTSPGDHEGVTPNPVSLSFAAGVSIIILSDNLLLIKSLLKLKFLLMLQVPLPDTPFASPAFNQTFDLDNAVFDDSRVSLGSGPMEFVSPLSSNIECEDNKN